MTPADIEVEIQRLREQVSHLQQRQADRKKNWRPFIIAGRFGGILFTLTGLGLILIADVFWDTKMTPNAHQFAEALAIQFIIASIPMGLIAQALAADTRTS